MAELTKCRDCAHELSPRARACPHCGRPVEHAWYRAAKMAARVMIVLLVVLIWLATRESAERPAPVASAPAIPPRALVADVVAGPPAPTYGRLKVDRVWDDHGYARGIVTYTNTTGRAVERVKIQCIVLKKPEEKIGVAESYLDDGRISPGESRTDTVITNVHGAAFDGMRCDILSAR